MGGGESEKKKKKEEETCEKKSGPLSGPLIIQPFTATHVHKGVVLDLEHILLHFVPFFVVQFKMLFSYKFSIVGTAGNIV